ncbi:MAG: outer membrane protein assembly factor BamA, partial [Prevotella sp.]|nr:outer membrane protein assembly factor BamA [Prevotella sp.]
MKAVLLSLFHLFTFSPLSAQDKIINPDISYAGTPRSCTIGGITTSGVEGYEDYVLTGLSGLTVGQQIEVPGIQITEAVKRYWRNGLFSKVQISADSIVGSKIYLHIALALHPRVSNINYIGVKKTEREDLESKLGMVRGMSLTRNVLDRAKILAVRYFDEKGYKNAEIDITQREDLENKG